jgi:hypothetical protein
VWLICWCVLLLNLESLTLEQQVHESLLVDFQSSKDLVPEVMILDERSDVAISRTWNDWNVAKMID